MWSYSQSTGQLSRVLDGDEVSTMATAVATGYSGAGQYKNDPAAQNLIDQGPIPQGRYTILDPINSHVHGPYAMPLVPDAANEMFGRAGFMIHGDSVVEPGTASEGCVILPRPTREDIWTSGDHTLEVTA